MRLSTFDRVSLLQSSTAVCCNEIRAYGPLAQTTLSRQCVISDFLTASRQSILIHPPRFDAMISTRCDSSCANMPRFFPYVGAIDTLLSSDIQVLHLSIRAMCTRWLTSIATTEKNLCVTGWRISSPWPIGTYAKRVSRLWTL